MTHRATLERTRRGAALEHPGRRTAATSRPEALAALALDAPDVSPADIHRLQRAAGNDTVRAVLQRARAGVGGPTQLPGPVRLGRDATAAGDGSAASVSRPTRIAAGAVLPPVTAIGRPQVIQRTTYKFTLGSWVQTGPTTGQDRYQHPSEASWTSPPKEGDTYDRDTGKITRSGTKEHLLDYAAGDRAEYGKWYMPPKTKKKKKAPRRKTAYSYLSGKEGGSEQGPHTFAFIGKRAAAEASVRSKKKFDPRNIKQRSALIPSPGQNRALVRVHEENTGIPIPKGRKRKLDQAYSDQFQMLVANLTEPDAKRAKTGTPRARQAVVNLMELSALGTYALGRQATDDELKGKQENRGDAVEDLKQLAGLDTGADLPAGLNVFDPNIVGHHKKHIAQFGRALGKLASGNEGYMSDLDLSSDDEYSEDEKPPDLDVVDEDAENEDEMETSSS